MRGNATGKPNKNESIKQKVLCIRVAMRGKSVKGKGNIGETGLRRLLWTSHQSNTEGSCMSLMHILCHSLALVRWASSQYKMSQT